MNEVEIRSFARLCHSAIHRGFDEGDFQLLQRYASGIGQGEFALYLRQLKKLEAEKRGALLDMFCENQVFSKLWLIETLAHIFPAAPRKIRLLGGWAGFQALLFRWLWNADLRIVSVDLDASACESGRLLCEPFGEDGGLVFETGDLFANLARSAPAGDELVICTIAEHLENPADLIRDLPRGTWLAIQGSSDDKPFDHVSAFASMDAFRAATPLSEVFFEGSLPWQASVRWMRIGQV